MKTDWQPRWCADENCAVRPHVENCPECFGFGLRGNGIPITAGEVMTWDGIYVKCPTCEGSPSEAWRIKVGDAHGGALVETEIREAPRPGRFYTVERARGTPIDRPSAIRLHHTLTRLLPLAGTRQLSDGPTVAELTLEATFTEALEPALEQFYRHPLRNGIEAIPDDLTEAQLRDYLANDLSSDAATAVLVFVILQNMQQGVNVGGQMALAELGLSGTFNLTNEQIRRQIERFVGRLVSRGGQLSLVQTTARELARQIVSLRAAGLSALAITAGLGVWMGGRVVTRAAGIGATEAVRATRGGLAMTFGRNGIEWMVHRITATACPICAPLAGERYPVVSGFVVGAIPLHPNCNCFYEPDTAEWTVPEEVWTGA